jgi:HTH-type transcriptional regulator/antitoxin HigA
MGFFMMQSVMEPTNDEEFQHLLEAMNQLVDMGATDQSHPLAGMLYTVGLLVEAYEKEHDSTW